MPGVGHLQNVHPLFVHYPIALLAAATLFYVVAWLTRSERWAFTAYVALLAGTAGGALAIATGLYAEGGVMVSRSVRAAPLNNTKRWMLITGESGPYRQRLGHHPAPLPAQAAAALHPPAPGHGRRDVQRGRRRRTHGVRLQRRRQRLRTTH